MLANVLFGLISVQPGINSQRVSKAIINRKPQTLFTATIFSASSVIYLSGFNSIISLISLVASIIVVSNYKINNKVISGLLPVAVIAMFENGDRFAVIFVLTVLFVPKNKDLETADSPNGYWGCANDNGFRPAAIAIWDQPIGFFQ